MVTLTADVTAEQESWNVSAMPDGDYAQVDSEVVRILDKRRQENRLRLVRGYAGTLAASHASGAVLSTLHVPSLPLDIFIGTLDPRYTSSAVAVVANTLYLQPFRVNQSVILSTAWYRPVVQSGNICIAIYDADGNQLATTGSVACGATGAASAPFSVSVELVVGQRYYLGFQVNNATATFSGVTSAVSSSFAAVFGHGVIAGAAFPAPASIDVGTLAATTSTYFLLLT